jgi:hypothetical protein
MMRGTAVGATGDALGEFNEALSAGSVFEARDYSLIAVSFSRRIINLSSDCGTAINEAGPQAPPSANRIKRLASTRTHGMTPVRPAADRIERRGNLKGAPVPIEVR